MVCIEIREMIRPMTEDERKAAQERNNNNNWRKCVSCGNASKSTLLGVAPWCSFCLEEE